MESEMLPYLQVNKSVVCQGFMDVGRRRDHPESVTKDFITPDTATSTSFRYVSATLTLIPTGQCREGQVTCTSHSVRHKRGLVSLGKPNLLCWTVSLLLQRELLYLPTLFATLP